MSSVKFAPLVIQTEQHRITGSVSVPTMGRSRLSDYANEPSREFFSVKDATIAPLDASNRVEHKEFVLVARRQIVLIMPGDEPAGS